MAQFVGERHGIFQPVVEIQQDEGMDAVDSPRISTALFALIFVNIDPAGRQGLVQYFTVFFTQRMETLLHQSAGFFIIHFDVGVRDQRGIEVVHVHFIKLEHFFLERHIAVKRRQVFVDSIDEPVVNRNRNIVRLQRGGDRRVVFAGAGVKNILFYRAAERGGERVAILGVGGEQLLEGFLADIAVRRHDEGPVAAFAELRDLTLIIFDFREFHVGAGQHGEDVFR